MQLTLHAGHILQVSGNPFALENPEDALQWLAAGALAVDEQGKIVESGELAALKRAYPGAALVNHGEQLLIPGFIDTHIHFPQCDITGFHSGELLDWLKEHAFPSEMRFADKGYAEAAASFFVDELFYNGTTTAVVFSSVHHGATDALFQAFAKAKGRAVIGKVSMDRHAPKDLTEEADLDLIHSQDLIKRWHGFDGRLYYALTPRFAPSCSHILLQQIQDLKEKNPSLYVQTHFAENQDELAWVAELFPDDGDYLAVYERYGLIGERTILAHGIYGTPGEYERILAKKAAISHCPTSNLFLGSGLFPLCNLAAKSLHIALGTDVGGGTSFSLWDTMNEAYKISKLRGQPCHPVQLFYLATLGGAEVLGMANQLGNFASGKAADFQVIDWRRNRILKRLFEDGASPVKKLASLIHHSDDRLLTNLYISGKSVIRDGVRRETAL